MKLCSSIFSFGAWCIFTLAISLTAGIDEQALKRERKKEMVKIDIKAITKEFNDDEENMQKALDEAYENMTPSEYYPIYSHFEGPINIVKDEAEEEAYRRRMHEYKQKELKAQRSIEQEILEFCQNNKIYGQYVKNFYLAKREQNKWPSDIAILIADVFSKKKEYTLAKKFYYLARNCSNYDGKEDLTVGLMLISYINDTIDNEKPALPTPALFSAVIEAIKACSNGEYYCDIGFLFKRALMNMRDLMVRWPISPSKLMNDNFYGRNELIKRIYDHNFVDGLINDTHKFIKIFQANRFGVNAKENNLLFALKEAGFKGIIKSFGDNDQYIWVDQKGYIVRIKYFTGHQGKGQWQFTIGLTFNNPYIWKNNDAIAVKKHRDLAIDNTEYKNQATRYDDLPSYEYNEIFKIIVDGKLLMLAPSFKSFYWHLKDNSLNQVMDQAHKDLNVVSNAQKIMEHMSFNYYGQAIAPVIPRVANHPESNAPRFIPGLNAIKPKTNRGKNNKGTTKTERLVP